MRVCVRLCRSRQRLSSKGEPDGFESADLAASNA